MPSWPPAPGIRTRPDRSAPKTASVRSPPLAGSLQWFPPPPVGAVPLDGLGQRFVERPLLAPPELGDLGDVHRVPAVVAEAVGHVVDDLLADPEQRQQLVD